MNVDPRYIHSEQLLERALRTIPLGAQTFSKSLTQYPRGSAPFFAERAQDARVWDVDGNEYIDFNNALCSVTLGHCHPAVTAAVEAQLKRGTIFSLSSALEVEVAELICEVVPSAERVRFGKNGSDATAGAVRAARAFTGRDHVAVCGYHGWQDWYIGTTARRKGVPANAQSLTHPFPYNDLAALEALLTERPGEFAAIVIEPMNTTWPEPNYLQGIVDLGRKHGAVVVFDETITGFRFALGGAQELFGVTPDLTCLGKGLANGYPLAAVAGRADIMREFEDVFFSFTMGGETLSLAAAKAAIAWSRNHESARHMTDLGQQLLDQVQAAIDRHDCGSFLKLAGHPSWSFLMISEPDLAAGLVLKTLFMQETLARNVLTLGTHNMSAAHTEQDVAQLVAVYDAVFPLLRQAWTGRAGEMLRCAPLQPLFKVR